MKLVNNKKKSLNQIKLVRYPFVKWLSKPITVLVRGIDYEIDSAKMAQQIRNKVWELEMDVSFKVRPHAISITVWDHIQPRRVK